MSIDGRIVFEVGVHWFALDYVRIPIQRKAMAKDPCHAGAAQKIMTS